MNLLRCIWRAVNRSPQIVGYLLKLKLNLQNNDKYATLRFQRTVK